MRPRSLFQCGSVRVGCVQGDGVYVYNESTKTRLRLGDCDENECDVRSQILQLRGTNSYLVAVGYRNSKRQRSLRFWRYDIDDSSCTALEWSSTATNAIPGFGFAVQGEDNEGDTIYFASGLGKGIARLWMLSLDTELKVKLVAVFKAKYTSMASVFILPSARKFFVGSSYDLCVQEWSFNPSSISPQEQSGKEARVLTKREIKSELPAEFWEDVSQPDARPNVLEYLDAHPDWKDVFPPLTLDPTTYVGEVNERGQPHGQGRRALVNDFYLLFEGEWRDGLPVKGVIKGDRYEYQGEVTGEDAIPHGWGREIRNCGGAEMEVYTGGWKQGERHGMFALSWRNTNPTKSHHHGINEYGFYHEGKQQGLIFHEWEADSPELPFASGKDQEARSFGSIRCIQQKQAGQVIDEFHFHRVDGTPWTKESKRCFNVRETNKGPASFARKPRADRTECFACLKECVLNDALVCLGCSMRVHREECAYPSEYLEQSRLNDLGFVCLMCSSLLTKRKLTVMDRHGEPVCIESKQDIMDITSAANPSLQNDGDDEDPIVIYALNVT